MWLSFTVAALLCTLQYVNSVARLESGARVALLTRVADQGITFGLVCKVHHHLLKAESLEHMGQYGCWNFGNASCKSIHSFYSTVSF